MKVSLEDKKIEAIRRMKMLDLSVNVVNAFEKDGTITVFDTQWKTKFKAEENDIKRIKEFEEEYSVLVYGVIRWYTDIGEMDSYLLVGDYREEWEQERSNLRFGEAFVYVYNHDAPFCSEFGLIGIRKTGYGLARIW